MKIIMASKAILSFSLIILFSSYLHVGLCQTSLDDLLPGLGNSAFIQDAKCMQKLLPCQEYVKTQSNPSEACCGHLEEMQENDTQCLCSFINKPQLLQSISVTKDDILKLPQACGIKVELDRCNNAQGDTNEAGSAGGDNSESDIEDESAEAKDKASSTKMITPYGVSIFVALLIALVFSSY